MIDQRFMQSLADDMLMPPEEAQPEMLLAAGPARTDEPQAFVGTRLNVPKAGQAQPTTQDRERLAVGLLDSLAGALRGAAAQTLGLPGDIRSIIDMIAQEGAEKYLGQRSFATTEEILQDTSVRVPGTNINVPFPPVLGENVPRREERQPSVETAQEVGTFLPAPGIPEAVVRGGKMIGRAVQATKNMPVGMSTQMVGESVSDLGFYSAAKQAVDSIQQPKGTGSQFLAQIEKTPGVKPDEIKWTGLDDFLKSKKSVTKTEVQEFLDKNRVEIKEVKLSDPTEADIQAFLNDEAGAGFTRAEAVDYLRNDEGATKFSKYTLPGGENYREILLTLPSKTLDKNSPEMIAEATKSYGEKLLDRLSDAQWKLISDRLQNSPEFKSQHFDQPNILAHMRVNDRVDADGKKVLFIEEVQSDWHQAGRKKGYDTPEAKATMQKRVDELEAEREKLYTEQARLEKLAEPFTSQGKDAPADILDQWNMVSNRLNNVSSEWSSAKNALATGGNLVPDAPFKTTWHELAMKRAIQLAAEGGYDRVAFTTGKTQAERYDLSKQIDELQISKDRDGNYTVGMYKVNNDDELDLIQSKYDVKESDLEGLVGKDIAQKAIEGQHTFEGGDLSVGGEGMKGFYDQILPKFLDKYAKKWDAKTGMTDIIVGKGKPTQYADFAEYNKAPSESKVSVQYIDVTPKMKESVLTKGQPLFAIGAGGAAVQQEENQ